MAFSTINKSSEHFNTKLWTGTGDATTTVSGVGFQPDWTWIKNRDVGDDHALFDAVRGVEKILFSNSTSIESTNTESLTAFNSDGFVTGNHRGTGGDAGNKMVSWNWKANGAGSSNTDGSITSTVSANTTAGFSIVKYTGNNGASGTVGHGLGVKPKMIITKGLTYASSWATYHEDITADYWLQLCETDEATDNDTIWNDTEPTSTLFTVGSSNQVNDNYNYIAYCFAEVPGYSKMGKYIGNGNDANGTFVYTGFKTSFVLVKKTSGTDNWTLSDHKRDVDVSPNFARLAADTYATEADNITWARVNKFSNGFRLGGTDSVTNESGSTYVYMAFGQPIISNSGVCTTAR